MVLWGLFERNVIKVQLKKKAKNNNRRKTLQEETSLQVGPLRALQKDLLCCCRKELMKCHCQSKRSSQSSSLTLPLERGANLQCQTHHSWISAWKHLPILSNCSFTVPYLMWHWTFVTVLAQKEQLLKFGESFKYECLREKRSQNQSKSVWKG